MFSNFSVLFLGFGTTLKKQEKMEIRIAKKTS